MKGKWQRFGFFSAAVIALIVMMMLGARGESLSASEVFGRVAFIGFISYLLTFAVWPRGHLSRSGQAVDGEPDLKGTPTVVGPLAEPPQAEPPAAPPQPDQRPVAIIQPRPAGSRPGARVHIPESPTSRNPRGRRLVERPSQRDFDWPARH